MVCTVLRHANNCSYTTFPCNPARISRLWNYSCDVLPHNLTPRHIRYWSGGFIDTTSYTGISHLDNSVQILGRVWYQIFVWHCLIYCIYYTNKTSFWSEPSICKSNSYSVKDTTWLCKRHAYILSSKYWLVCIIMQKNTVINSFFPGYGIWHCRKPLLNPLLTYCRLSSKDKNHGHISQTMDIFLQKSHWKMSSLQASMCRDIGIYWEDA